MKMPSKNTPNHSAHPFSTFKLSWFSQSLAWALAAILCGLAISGLSIECGGQTQATSSAVPVDHSTWVQAPGELVRPDCVHEIPNGAVAEVTNDGQLTGDVTLNGTLIAHYNACSESPVITRPRGRTGGVANPPGTGNGWIEASQREASLSSSDNLDFLSGTWTVPSYPSLLSGQLLYVFNAIEPASGDWILQPVLQYGVSPAGGGNYWAIASWLVGANGYAFHSPLVKVAPGNSIFGYTEMTAVSGDTSYWAVEARDTTTGAYSWITAHVSGQHWTWAYAAVLEAYNVTSCENFPSAGHAIFNGTVVDHGFPKYESLSQTGWYGAIYSYGGPSCEFAVVAGSESTLHWMQTANF